MPCNPSLQLIILFKETTWACRPTHWISHTGFSSSWHPEGINLDPAQQRLLAVFNDFVGNLKGTSLASAQQRVWAAVTDLLELCCHCRTWMAVTKAYCLVQRWFSRLWNSSTM